MRSLLLVLVVLVVAVASRPVAAEPVRPDVGGGYVAPPAGHDIVITTPGERSTKNVVVLASIAVAGALVGGVGVYFNLDSKSAADKVSAKEPNSLPWTSADQKTYDRAHSSAVAAEVAYSVGGTLVLAAAIGYILTAPKSETTVIHPHVSARAMPVIAPAPGGGAILGGAWRF